MKIDDWILEMQKIQAIADLLVSHTDEEFQIIGKLLSDLTHPLLHQMQENRRLNCKSE